MLKEREHYRPVQIAIEDTDEKTKGQQGGKGHAPLELQAVLEFSLADKPFQHPYLGSRKPGRAVGVGVYFDTAWLYSEPRPRPPDLSIFLVNEFGWNHSLLKLCDPDDVVENTFAQNLPHERIHRNHRNCQNQGIEEYGDEKGIE